MKRQLGTKALAIVAMAVPITMIAGCTAAPQESGNADAQTGGTLLVAGNADVLYMDPAASYSAQDSQLHRLITRSLFADVLDLETGDSNLVPDLALEIPTIENGGVSEDGLTYTIELQEGVNFDAPDGPRAIVADDVVRSVKRICNPVSPSVALSYYTATIDGLEAYCEGFSAVAADVDAIRDYVESNDIAGVEATNDNTVTFTLTQPATDFISILALSVFMAPQPVEYLDYLPDSPELRQNMIASGPYRITEYTPNEKLILERNPNWDAEKDNVREAYVDAVEISMGQEAAAVQQQLEAGTVDMQWSDTVTPTASVPALLAANDERLVIGGSGGIKPYIVINTLSPNADGAFADTEVRQALNFAVNRAAIQQTLGGPGLAEIAKQILPPEVLGDEPTNALDVPDEGDQEKSKQILEDAGYSSAVPVRVLYRETEPYASIAAILQQDLEAAGFAVDLRVTTQNAFYGEFLLNEDVTRAGEWDIGIAAWGADYLDGRAYLVPMLDGRNYEGGSANFGAWNNDDFNEAIDTALEATDPEEASASWKTADEIATTDAAWVPVAFTRTPVFSSSRVGGFGYLDSTRNGDMANVWLNQ
ncbi:Oligopeptide ABC transporter, periplasmic oligopeptide-binding protein OppA [Leifsonia rubra CMS 76R]|nr:Oligopeptide ABC transporter, periplasmic oligopeptide-binding protein OppA [Leifsonia rubra CMS 76R]